MENEKAIEIFNKWMDCKDAYQADPSCDGNCFSCEYYASAEEEKEAMLLAISALKKQEQSCDTCKHRNEHFSGKRCSDCSVGYPDRYEAESNFEATSKNFEPYTEEDNE